MVELVVTRGLPGCGKTTWAKAWVAEDVAGRARVERDQLRNMMHDGVWQGRVTESTIVLAQHAMIRALLRDGISVVVSDTNLHPGVYEELNLIAYEESADFQVEDFTDMPLEQVLKQNAQRTGKEFIPKESILNMYRRYIAK